MIRLLKALKFSLQGIQAAFRDEAAFRQEIILSAILIPTAFFLAPDKISLLLMVGSVLLVLTVELLNTAVESAINHIGTDIHPLSKKAKDCGSAAVLIALTNAGLVWSLILFF